MSPKRLWLLIQLAGTLVLLALLARDFNWPSFVAVVEKISPWFYAWSLALLLLGQVLYAVKWWVVLLGMGVKVPFPRVLGQYLISLFFGNFLPTSIGGDLARIYYLGQKEGYVTIGASVLVDRCLGLLWIGVLATALSWSLTISSPEFLLARDLVTAFCVVSLIGLAVLLLLPVRHLSLRALGLPLLPPSFGERIRRLTLQMRGAARQPAVLAQVLVVVAMYFALLGVIYRSFFLTALGDEVEFLPIVTGLLGIAVLSNLPVTVNGIGLREQLHYVIFATIGVSKEASVAVSLLIFSQLLLVGLLGFALWLRMKLASPAAEQSGERDLPGEAPGVAR